MSFSSGYVSLILLSSWHAWIWPFIIYKIRYILGGNFKRYVIMYTVKNKQSVRGEALSASPSPPAPPHTPENERESGKEIKRGGGAPHCSRHCSGISPLHCDGQAFLQVGERLGFPSNLFETATQFSLERGSLWPKRACHLDGHQCEVVALVEGCVTLRALLSPYLSGGNW